jgi:two-component system, NarL family, response regulator
MDEPRPIRIMVADDDENVRQMIETLMDVTPDMELVAQASQGAEAVRSFIITRPDVVLMDLDMPLMNGLETIRSISRDYPAARIIVYSANVNQHSLKLMLQAGAVGYLEKPCPIAEILCAIRNAHAGIL